MMMNSSVARRSFERSLRLLGGAAMALLMLSTVTSQRADALSPINPGNSGAKTINNGLAIEVRGGHAGGGGGHGGGGHGIGGGGFSGVRAGTVSSGAAISGGSGARVGHVAGGRGFRHRHGFFIGGVYYDDYPYEYGYPYYDDPAFIGAPGCRIVQTINGPRPVCHRAARHYRHYEGHHRHRHHHA